MAGEFLRKKWESQFDKNDLNKDGVMTMDDANIFAERFAEHHKMTGEKAQQLKVAFQAVWNSSFLFGQEKMDRATFLWKMDKEYTDDKPKLMERIRRASQDCFDLFDVNHDGLLSEEEYLIVCKCWGVESFDRKHVQSYPQIKPGFIGKQDFVDSWVAFCTNDDSSNTELEQPISVGFKIVDQM